MILSITSTGIDMILYYNSKASSGDDDFGGLTALLNTLKFSCIITGYKVWGNRQRAEPQVDHQGQC